MNNTGGLRIKTDRKKYEGCEYINEIKQVEKLKGDSSTHPVLLADSALDVRLPFSF